jgi:hypothetical protein
MQLKDYVEKVLQLEAEKDALQLQLEVLKHQQQQQPPAAQHPSRLAAATAAAAAAGSSGSSEAELAKEQELFELRLQKEQAVAAAARLKQQLFDLFGTDAGHLSSLYATLEAAAGLASSNGSRTLDIGSGVDIGSSNSSSRVASSAGGIDAAPTHGSASGSMSANASLGGTNRMRRSAAGSASGGAAGVGAAAGKLSGREADLLTTVANLKAALERAMACSTPNTRFMQVGPKSYNIICPTGRFKAHYGSRLLCAWPCKD